MTELATHYLDEARNKRAQWAEATFPEMEITAAGFVEGHGFSRAGSPS
jgi:hypothetical protein